MNQKTFDALVEQFGLETVQRMVDLGEKRTQELEAAGVNWKQLSVREKFNAAMGEKPDATSVALQRVNAAVRHGAMGEDIGHAISDLILTTNDKELPMNDFEKLAKLVAEGKMDLAEAQKLCRDIDAENGATEKDTIQSSVKEALGVDSASGFGPFWAGTAKDKKAAGNKGKAARFAEALSLLK